MQPTDSTPVRNHINNFDFLRLLFATLVLITHSYPLAGVEEKDLLSQWSDGQISFSTLAVRGFFIISGYLILKSLLRSKDLKDYFFKRIIRIFPALWVVVLLTILVCYFFSNKSAQAYFTHASTWSYLRTALLNIQFTIDGVFERNPYPQHTVNGSLWTIIYEVTFYILLVPFFFLRRNRSAVIFLAALAFFVAAGGYLFNKIHPFLYYPDFLNISITQVVFLGSFFMGGALLATIGLPSSRVRTWLVIATSIGLVLAAVFHVFEAAQLFLLPVLVISLGTVNYVAFSWVRRIGDISYGVYIYGFIIQQALAYLFHFNYIQLCLASIPVTWVFGLLSWHFVEKKPLLLKLQK